MNLIILKGFSICYRWDALAWNAARGIYDDWRDEFFFGPAQGGWCPAYAALERGQCVIVEVDDSLSRIILFR